MRKILEDTAQWQVRIEAMSEDGSSAAYSDSDIYSEMAQYLTCNVNPLKAELNPIRHLLALVGARHIVHVSMIRAKDHC